MDAKTFMDREESSSLGANKSAEVQPGNTVRLYDTCFICHGKLSTSYSGS